MGKILPNGFKKRDKGSTFFFSDETKIELGAYINDYIRLSKENKNKFKKGDEEAFNLINRPQKNLNHQSWLQVE